MLRRGGSALQQLRGWKAQCCASQNLTFHLIVPSHRLPIASGINFV
jgi:hypothetical protein